MKFRNGNVAISFVVALMCTAALAACTTNDSNDSPDDDQCVTCATSTSCNLVVTPKEKTFDYKGGSDYVTITLESNCAWTAESKDTGWLTIDGAASGSGRAQLKYIVAEYGYQSGANQREGKIEVKTNNKTEVVTIKQTPAPIAVLCEIDTLPFYLTLPALAPNRNSNIGISVVASIKDPVTGRLTQNVKECVWTAEIISGGSWLSMKENTNPTSSNVPKITIAGDGQYHVREGNNLSVQPREAKVRVSLPNGKVKETTFPQAGCVRSATVSCSSSQGS